MTAQDRKPVSGNAGAPFERIVIQVTTPKAPTATPLEVLSRVAVADLLRDVASALGQAGRNAGADPRLAFVTDSGTHLDPGRSLEAQGVRDGDRLRLAPAASTPQDTDPPHMDPAQLPGMRPTPISAPLDPALAGPCLACPRGWVFRLDEGLLHLGRHTSTEQPEIDLTELDPECASSRRHGEVHVRHAETTLIPCRTTNGTLLNGRWLDPGTPVILKSGDRLELGVDGVELVFFAPGQSVPADFFVGSGRETP